MAIAAIFEQQGMTAEQYDKVIKDLEAAGLGAPDGRNSHVACEIDGGFFVVDIWESPEKLQKFAEALTPIMEASGTPLTAPTIRPVHNIIKG